MTLTRRLKITLAACLWFSPQVVCWIFPASRFTEVANRIASYGWCSIICLIVAAIPAAGLLGLFLHVRDFLESVLHKK